MIIYAKYMELLIICILRLLHVIYIIHKDSSWDSMTKF